MPTVCKEIADDPARSSPTSCQRHANPAIAETVTLQVTMAPDAEPGQRELRLATPPGLSNPLVFCVGQLPEFSRAGPRRPVAEPTRLQGSSPAGNARNEPRSAAGDATQSRCRRVVNGQILPGDVDRYRFQARKGQQLVVAAARGS